MKPTSSFKSPLSFRIRCKADFFYNHFTKKYLIFEAPEAQKLTPPSAMMADEQGMHSGWPFDQRLQILVFESDMETATRAHTEKGDVNPFPSPSCLVTVVLQLGPLSPIYDFFTRPSNLLFQAKLNKISIKAVVTFAIHEAKKDSHRTAFVPSRDDWSSTSHGICRKQQESRISNPLSSA